MGRIFICGGEPNFGYRITRDTHHCKLCTDVGEPGGYIAHEEWWKAKTKAGEKQTQCPLCQRYTFKEQYKKPHGGTSAAINRMRKLLRSGVSFPQPTDSGKE